MDALVIACAIVQAVAVVVLLVALRVKEQLPKPWIIAFGILNLIIAAVYLVSAMQG